MTIRIRRAAIKEAYVDGRTNIFNSTVWMIIGLHHVQITIPPNAEEEAREFYCSTLSLLEIEKSNSLKKRGGFWIQVGDREVHIRYRRRRQSFGDKSLCGLRCH